MSVPQRLHQLQPPRALTSWVVGAITLLAIGAAWIVVDASRADATDFDASLIVAFLIPLVASALCIETLTREAWGNNRRVAPLVFWLWLLVMPLGVYSAAAYLVTLMPISYRGEGAGVWWGMLGIEAIALLMSPLLWFFVLFPLGALIPLVGKVARGALPPRALSGAVILLSLGGIIVSASIAFDFGGPRAWGPALLSVLGIPGNYDVESPVAAWICRALVLLIFIVLIDSFVVGRREKTDAAAPVPDAVAGAELAPIADPADVPIELPAQPARRVPKWRRPRPARREPSALDVYDVPEASDGSSLPPGAPKPPSEA